MTREEANEILETWNLCHYTPSREAAEVIISALDPLEVISALRPVSREQVEKVRSWRGEWVGVPNMGVYDTACSKCGYCPGIRFWDSAFCPKCGAPMTGEAVEMVLERLETLYETT